jgi:hypothetical protein
MIRTLTINDIPETWIFENYCQLSEKLHGQDLKITSLFNKEERTPSMCIYYKNGHYKFKDFSSGLQGTGINLVQHLYNISYNQACNKIVGEYLVQDKLVEKPILKKVSKFKVTSHTKRNWNVLDADFWTEFGISSDMLNIYNVYPLSDYVLSKNEDGNIKEMHVKGQYIYGYFQTDGTLCKIYRPRDKHLKFMNVSDFIQGSDQLEYKAPTLVICSSLKDGMALKELGLDVEFIAGNSENSMIHKSRLKSYAIKYKHIVTLFDNDPAGHMSMQKYKEQYNIPGIYLNLSKDLADAIRDYGKDRVKQILTHLLPK